MIKLKNYLEMRHNIFMFFGDRDVKLNPSTMAVECEGLGIKFPNIDILGMVELEEYMLQLLPDGKPESYSWSNKNNSLQVCPKDSCYQTDCYSIDDLLCFYEEDCILSNDVSGNYKLMEDIDSFPDKASWSSFRAGLLCNGFEVVYQLKLDLCNTGILSDKYELELYKNKDIPEFIGAIFSKKDKRGVVLNQVERVYSSTKTPLGIELDGWNFDLIMAYTDADSGVFKRIKKLNSVYKLDVLPIDYGVMSYIFKNVGLMDSLSPFISLAMFCNLSLDKAKLLSHYIRELVLRYSLGSDYNSIMKEWLGEVDEEYHSYIEYCTNVIIKCVKCSCAQDGYCIYVNMV